MKKKLFILILGLVLATGACANNRANADQNDMNVPEKSMAVTVGTETLAGKMAASEGEESKMQAAKEAEQAAPTKGMMAKEAGQAAPTKAMAKEQAAPTKAVAKPQGENAATEIKLKDLNGDEFVLSNEVGKKVYVKYWASWCPICLAGMDELDELSTTTDYEVVTVVSPGNLGEKNKDEFISWFNSLGYSNIRVLLDEEGQFIQDYAIRSTPTGIIVDSEGNLVKKIPGPLSREVLDKIFANIA